jgi:uncharacterized protein (TIGR03435 family)
MVVRSVPSLKFSAGFLLLGAAVFTAFASPSFAQQNASVPTSASSPMFEVVSIKPHKSGENAVWSSTTLDRFSTSGVSAGDLICSTYHLIMPDQISGLPEWSNSGSFDIEAKLDEDTAAALHKLPREERARQWELMMQAVLADRFQLKVHHETKDLPVYDLVVAKSGLKIKQSPANMSGGWSLGLGKFEGKGVPIDEFTRTLSNLVGRLVVNKTGLTGNYAMTLKWTPDGTPESADSGPDIFAALVEQLGFKLEHAKGPVDTIVVDYIEKPSPN